MSDEYQTLKGTTRHHTGQMDQKQKSLIDILWTHGG